MTLLDKEGVKRVEKSLKEFDPKQNVIILKSSARTALEAARSLDCEVGAIVKSLLFKTENSFINSPKKHFFNEKNIPGELYEDEWVDFGYNRTKALEKAFDKSDYVLIFDADDELCGDIKIPYNCVYKCYEYY